MSLTVCGLDIETTSKLHPDHRIIQVYAALWDLGTKERHRVFVTNINPQRSIAAEAQAVHGISIAELEGCPLWHAPTVAPALRALMNEADVFVAHNGAQFDLPFINQELARVGLATIDRPIVDTMLQARWATPQGKLPSLSELCFACDVTYDPARAHDAAYDVEVMMACFFAGHAWGRFKVDLAERMAA